MKKYLYTILIIVVLIAGYFMSDSFFCKNQKDGENHEESKEISGFNYKEWKDYINNDYVFSLKYPSTWEVQEVLKPQDVTALHEIVFFEKEYEGYRADFRISIFTNNNEVDIGEWWNLRLANEDLKRSECVKEYGDNSPCVFLRELLTKEEKTTLSGSPAQLVRIFQFDSEKECIYSMYGKYVYGVCYVGDDPNDSLFDQHKEVTRGIRESFVFISSSESKVEDKIIGKWISLDDSKSVKVFEKEQIAKEIYDGKIMSQGTWELTGENALRVLDNNEEYLFTILKLSSTELELSHLPRGNTLRYIRIED